MISSAHSSTSHEKVPLKFQFLLFRWKEPSLPSLLRNIITLRRLLCINKMLLSLINFQFTIPSDVIGKEVMHLMTIGYRVGIV